MACGRGALHAHFVLACAALAGGAQPPSDFNVALQVFILKGGPLPGTEGDEAKASQFRPWTLSTSCQKLITKAFGVTL